MTRDELRLALQAATGEGATACLSALDDPDVAVVAGPDADRPVPTASLLHAYRRRASHAHRAGVPAIGLDDAVRALAATPYEGLRVELAGGGVRQFPACTVFLAPDRPEVVAAVVVTGRPPL